MGKGRLPVFSRKPAQRYYELDLPGSIQQDRLLEEYLWSVNRCQEGIRGKIRTTRRRGKQFAERVNS